MVDLIYAKTLIANHRVLFPLNDTSRTLYNAHGETLDKRLPVNIPHPIDGIEIFNFDHVNYEVLEVAQRGKSLIDEGSGTRRYVSWYDLAADAIWHLLTPNPDKADRLFLQDSAVEEYMEYLKKKPQIVTLSARAGLIMASARRLIKR